MLGNYLKTAFRNLMRHTLYSFINIGGLSLGFASCILIFLFVDNELSYEEWLTDADRIFRLEGKYKGEGAEADNPMALSPGPLSKPLKANFGSMIEASTRMLTENFLVTRDEVKFLDRVNLIDATFFDVLDLPIITGERDRMFVDYQSVILSERAAEKYFGTENPVGQTLDFGFGELLVQVVGIMKNLPENSHLSGDIFLHYDESRYEDQPWVLKYWTASNVYTYMKLYDADQKSELEAAIPPFVDKNAVLHPSAPAGTIPSEVYQTRLMPIKDIHLYSNGRFQLKPGSDIVTVYSFSAIATLILVIAVINFTNLSTARASLRAQEITLRKVVGASRRHIVIQFLGETLLATLLALIIAFTIVEFTLPWFNEYASKLLSLSVFSDPVIQVGLVGVIAVASLGAGAHPALQISNFRPGKILHSNNAASHHSARLRYILTAVQFTISIGLMISTAVIYSQIKYAQSMKRGLITDNKLQIINMDYGPVENSAKAIQQEIDRLPGVKTSAFSERRLPLRSFWDWPIKVHGDGETEVLDTEIFPVSHEFLEFYDVKLVAGRFFSKEYTADILKPPASEGEMASQTAIISEKTVKYYGFGTPEEALGKTVYVDNFEEVTVAITIVGVVEDIYLRSARDSVDPVLFLVQEDNMWVLNIELYEDNVLKTLKDIDAVWNRIVPHFPLSRAFVDDNFDAFYQADEQRAHMFTAFSVFAIIVSCLGLYGLASFTAEQRVKEIGVRKVMGANVADIVRLLTFEFSKPVLLANLLAWPIAWYFAREWLNGFQHRIDLNISYFAVAGGLALVVACVTVAGHAYRTARANPISALRHE